MRKFASLFLLGFYLSVSAQSEYQVPMVPELWDFEKGKVEFIEHKGVQAVRMDQNSGNMYLKEYEFINGTIEFDVEVNQPGPFPSIYFRGQDGDTELVYLRTGPAGKANAFNILQYTSIISNVNLWDLHHEFQTAADIEVGEWNHIKIVAHGKQLRVYVNGDIPNLEIPEMEGNLDKGLVGIGTGFPGEAIFANLVIRPNAVEDLPAIAGPDITRHDTRFLRDWSISGPISLEKGNEVTVDMFTDEGLKWEDIKAERRGLINLSRKYGLSDNRRMVWLKKELQSDYDQTIELKVGFSDEMWVFLNGSPVYLDKNLYIENMRKSPNGRISIDNSTTLLQLKEGKNVLLIAVANDFFGWGLVARLEHVKGITY